MGDVLLTVSGTLDPAIADKARRRERPQPDYLELERALGAKLVDYAAARRSTGLLGGVIERVAGKSAMLAWACFSRRGEARTIVTDGEQVGIPLALLLKVFGRGPRSVRHAMIGHSLSAKKKALFFDFLGIKSHVDLFFVYCTAQKQILEARFGVPGERVVLTPFQVDTAFFSSEAAEAEPSDEIPRTSEPLICAVGLERRDYPTLLSAVEGLPVRLVITASSAWSKQVSSAEGVTVPPNVTVRQFSYPGLRQLYHEAAFMVMPLMDVDFAAGVTAILEAMAMKRAVICSRASGQTDVVVDGETGVYVPVGDAAALRRSILQLLEDREASRQMGLRGYELVRARMSLERYAANLAARLSAL